MAQPWSNRASCFSSLLVVALGCGCSSESTNPAALTGGSGGTAGAGTGGVGGSAGSAGSLGQPKQLAKIDTNPTDIALDGAAVYYAAGPVGGGKGEVARVPKDGSTPSSWKDAIIDPWGIAAGGTELVVADPVSFRLLVGASKAPLALTVVTTDPVQPYLVAADGLAIYYDDESSSPASVWRASPAGASPFLLTNALPTPMKMVLNGGDLWLTSLDQAAVYRVDTAVNGPPSELPVVGIAHARALAVNDTHVFVASFDGPSLCTDGNVKSTVYRLDKTGSKQTELTSGRAIHSMVVDAGHLYWTEPGTCPDFLDGSVMRIPLGTDAPTPETLAESQAAPAAIAVDASGVYWLNRGSSTASPPAAVMKLAKP